MRIKLPSTLYHLEMRSQSLPPTAHIIQSLSTPSNVRSTSSSPSQRSSILSNINDSLKNPENTTFSCSSNITNASIPLTRTQRQKARDLGDFNYYYSYMSQPKSQLETFKSWAGKDSDISYYLNSHHIDINASMGPDYKPTRVTASGSKGTAVDLGCVPETEDTISLLVQWQRKNDSSKIATAVYTASWTAPQKAGVHSNQYFHCM